jgi:DNA invertase Pin-like site-specific DNA recombinase
MQVVGYVRVSTDEQADSGAGLESQRRAIRAEAARRGWTVVALYEDAAASGKSLTGRPQLQAALRAVESGGAAAIVVAKLDRLSRSLLDFSGLMARSRRKGWALVALDLGVDTTTPSGEMMANVLAVFAQFERRLIGQRTKDALAVRKAQGVKLGRFKGTSASVRERIAELRTAGESLSAIARRLNDEHVPTAQGGQRTTAGRWYASTVRVVAAEDPSQADSPRRGAEPRDAGRAT